MEEVFIYRQNNVSEIEVPNYFYCINTWGEFFNKENNNKLNLSYGEYYFQKEEDRNKFYDCIKNESKESNYNVIINEVEGYHIVKERGLKFIVKDKENGELSCIKCPLPPEYNYHNLNYRLGSIDIKPYLDPDKEYKLVSCVLYGEWDVSVYIDDLFGDE